MFDSHCEVREDMIVDGVGSLDLKGEVGSALAMKGVCELGFVRVWPVEQ